MRLPEGFTSAFLVFGDLLAGLLALFERVVRFGCDEISLTGGSNLNGLLAEVG
ncbi:hypothetical protein COO91_10883 (plasmid) [Nostoc flagelliforme CCNUN1]|uniref:Uncharacterized protein n=1 Tax=Nostoc flagelliforme CCNUN1 TaxID=2038116 RepID=A0A2K8TC59_9NOSO|nr:hypothetical protein COO91_10480 [Nostoc flagelliforme CCNUN1]AUB44645.1 hypothetical protein COO91_10883 [Nostoc flagelliforme CCNUN1]